MNFQDKTEYGRLSTEVGNDNEVQSALKEGYEILKMVKDKGNEELYKKFSKEYEDLAKSIKLAIQEDKKISIGERTKIMLELGDIVKLAEDNGIIEKKGFTSWLGDKLKGTNTNEIKKKAEQLRDKNIDDYSKEEALSALTYLSENYSTKYKAIDGSTEKLLTLNYKTINELDDQYEVRLFQEKLIEKILGKGHKGYDSKGYIMAYNKGLGNYITNVPIVEKAIKDNNFQNVGNLAICNYLNYLEGTGKLTKEYFLNTFGKEKSEEILKFVEKNKEVGFSNYDKIIQTLTEVGAMVSKTIEEFKKNVFEYFTKILTSDSPKVLESNLKGIENLPKNEKEEILKMLEKELSKENSKLRNMFLQPLLEKGKSPKEAERIVNEVIENIKNNLTPEKFGEACIIIEKFNKDNKANINVKYSINKINEVVLLESKIKTVKVLDERNNALKNGDKKGVKVAEKILEEQRLKILQTNATQRIIDNTTEEQARQIGTGKLDYKTHLEKLRKDDKVLDEELKNLEKEQEKLGKRYSEENLNKSSNNNQSSTKEIFSYSDGTILNYSQISSGEYLIKTNSGNIEINNEEFKIIKNNKEALKNMINFRETLEELNLGGLFKYRNSIFKAISNKYSMEFNTRDDYLNKNELIIFIEAILQSTSSVTGYKSKSNTNIENLKLEVMSINKVGIIGGIKDINIYGNSLIESIFIEKFDSKRTSILDQNIFEKSLDNLFGKTV